MWLRNKLDSAMQPGYMVENCTPVSAYRRANSLMSNMLHNLESLYALAPMNRSPSIIAFWFLSPPRKPVFKPSMSPKFALGGTWPANVFVFPVTEPTMINLFCSAFALTLSLSNNNNANTLLETLLRKRRDRRVR